MILICHQTLSQAGQVDYSNSKFPESMHATVHYLSELDEYHTQNNGHKRLN